MNPRAFYTEPEEDEIRRAFAGYEGVALRPVFDHLDGRIGYGKLRLFRAFNPFRKT